jgi:hypothetical protein
MRAQDIALILQKRLKIPIIKAFTTSKPEGVRMKGLNKLLNLFAITLLFSTVYAELSWDDAKAQILKKAETISKDYDAELCPNTLPIYSAITSEENAEAWDIAKEIIDDVIKTAIYKKASETPNDNVLKSETIIQASMLIGQKISARTQKDMVKTIALSIKTGAIIGSYFELLFDSLKEATKA